MLLSCNFRLELFRLLLCFFGPFYGLLLLLLFLILHPFEATNGCQAAVDLTTFRRSCQLLLLFALLRSVDECLVFVSEQQLYPASVNVRTIVDKDAYEVIQAQLALMCSTSGSAA